MTARTPYQDTSVSVAKTQDEVRVMLRNAGARGMQIEEDWATDPPSIVVRFLWPISEDFERIIRVRLKATPLPPEKGARDGWRVSPEQRERQAWRALAWYLKTMLEAATFGLLRFEDVFLSFVEGEDGRTIGEHVIPMLEQGRLQLASGDSEAP